MNIKKFKVAVIGCGRIAGHHARSIEQNEYLELAAVCDLAIDRAEAYGTEFKIPYFVDYREMFKAITDLDIVVIATPSGMHFEHAMEVMEEYSKHVVIEKPTFMRPEQLMHAKTIALKKGLQIFPVFQNRYNSAVERVRKALQNDELGDIRIMNVRLRWCRPQRYYDLSPWRGTYSHDGGAITNQGIHHIDLLRYLGGEVDRVSATMRTLGANIEVEDSVVATFAYANGAIGSLEVTTAARPDDFEASLSIVGSKGLAQLGGIAVNKLEIFTPQPADCITFSDDFSDLPDRGRVYGRGHGRMYEDIAAFFIKNKNYPVSLDDCANTINLLHAFYSSDEKGGWININDHVKSERLGRTNDSISDLYRTK
ncbi:Predicted dehydrogenase [Hydrobacter penzbergensis]|uniref:Predicted dehydrogenase n=1 Tax=Hydrobacter penzbergensis TaxID=1235997 RepID=A0A8X8IF43_9BACT|nr:Gfo/Idh/MocA family oxidoreductase [Hydrobacter penzbergensis]SDW86090.1 Predicted dehydrogenase [Hydrobacter penzbergensis]